MEMELRLQRALDQKKVDDLKIQSEMFVTRSLIVTPGSRMRAGTPRMQMMGTPRIHAAGRGTPRNPKASETPKGGGREQIVPRTPRGL